MKQNRNKAVMLRERVVATGLLAASPAKTATAKREESKARCDVPRDHGATSLSHRLPSGLRRTNEIGRELRRFLPWNHSPS